VAQRLLPRLTRPAFDPALSRPLLRFGAAMVVSGLAGTVIVHGDRFLLVRLTSISSLAHYSVAFSLANVVTMLSNALCQPLLPAFSRLRAETDPRELQRIYGFAMRGIVLCLLPAAVLLYGLGEQLLTLWVGAEFARESTMPLRILAAGAMFHGVRHICLTLLGAVGKTDLLARYHLLELVPYAAGAALLIHRFGASGAALAWTLRALAEAVLFFHAIQREVDLRVSPFRNARMWAVCVAALAAPVLLTAQVDTPPAVVAALTCLSVLIYAAVTWFSVLTLEERRVARALIPVNLAGGT
jgi:O-antigen/teichoic acid export membrane protein